MIGISIEVCPDVKAVAKVPVKPVPVTVKVAVPAVAFVKPKVKVAVCPAVPLAVNVPAAVAAEQSNVNVAGVPMTLTSVEQDDVPCGEVMTIGKAPTGERPS